MTLLGCPVRKAVGQHLLAHLVVRLFQPMGVREGRVVTVALNDHQPKDSFALTDFPSRVHVPKHLAPGPHPRCQHRCLPLGSLAFDDYEKFVCLEASVRLGSSLKDVPGTPMGQAS
jgi:hypothetical protein